MGAVYIFVGVAFILGLLVASIWHRARGGLSRLKEVAFAQSLVTAMQRLDDTRGPEEVGGVLLETLASQLDCGALALYLKGDVDLNLAAARGMNDSEERGLRERLDNDSNLSAPAPGSARVVHVNDTAYALVVLPGNQQGGVVAVAPPAAVASKENRQCVEATGAHALARLETLHLGTVLREMATQDAVTRLHNQRYFLELLELEFNRSVRYQRAVAVLLCGVNQLAEFNHRQGSEAGDTVLRQIANAFRGGLRYFDVIGRYERDTLAVLLPEAGRDVATRVAERLHVAASAEAEIQGLGVSIGVACAARPNVDSLAFLNTAREALREARQSGLDQVFVREVVEG